MQVILHNFQRKRCQFDTIFFENCTNYLNGPIHTGNNIAQYGLHSTVCAGNCVVCKGGIGGIAQTGLHSFAVQKFGRPSAQSCRLHRHLSPVCTCMPLCICTGNNVISVIFHSATVTEEYQVIFIILYLPFHS